MLPEFFKFGGHGALTHSCRPLSVAEIAASEHNAASYTANEFDWRSIWRIRSALRVFHRETDLPACYLVTDLSKAITEFEYRMETTPR